MTELREDGFLGGRLRILQPARGYRAGADAVMLAAACPARTGESVLELGCGAGVAMLCLGARVPGLRLAGLELQPSYAELARQNAATNAIAAELHQGDLARMPAALREQSFDHVIANPPYFIGGSPAPDEGRGRARHEVTPLPLWIEAGLRRLRPGGWITLIQRADRLGAILAALSVPAGAITILPVTAREGREAGRVIVCARKGARAPLRLLSPFVMHAKPSHSADREDLTEAAQAVLRGGAALSLGPPNFR
ncbi:tRNA1(Val) (adenine(37)-N6)-methyltransferase [Paracoccus denitrificans]|jgi:tRNA1(Val) A37 N6-methylase TrmN6|uniref:Methyltransferase small n=1 Tax=Paracoccus denitrificans (strain Pd 1222) TaxID=318586 RepID=A1B3M7_PARDP|nr:methyltransferase [Paracoccus denitrificans]ABL70121.1 methyltransferase small [Paracoccus denitrificans PD1222]MBB4628839.1 tRNA1(Val) A37 N6-methylase TrmN6 [Paracoccus denitrificans]MCU7429778.1 methyltransferase [Paracoccus denitrificans]QAR25493.1 methyltransferase domain-containing protein [Paracoccus denitrificans]UPV94384.1 methyltransferase [Paracoccus denitrificans]